MTVFWRIVFSLAILGNLLFFIWGQGYFGRIEDGREPQRVGHQLEPEKLRITEVPTAPPMPPAELCRIVSGEALTAAEAQRIQDKVLAEAGAGTSADLKFTVKPIELPPRHWVYIPPLASKVLVDKKLLELKQRGITDMAPILAEGSDRFAISLGLFSSAAEAAKRLEALTQLGVRSAVIQIRPSPTGKVQLEVHGAQEALLKQLPELLDGLGLSSTHIEDCTDKK